MKERNVEKEKPPKWKHLIMSSPETFSLCFSKIAESFENLEDILPDWVDEDVEKSLVETVDKFQKQEKDTFLCRK